MAAGRLRVPKPGKSLAERKPDMALEWHAHKNSLTPLDVTCGADVEVWWRCSNAHEWQETVKSRAARGRCRYCTNHAVWVGFNDLAHVHPEWLDEWDYEVNADLLPTGIVFGAAMEVAWKCRLDHQWNESPSRKHYAATKGTHLGCPYCSGQRVLAGFNDLLTTHPELAREWDVDANLIGPDEVSRGSGMAHWVCDKEHRWEATVASRAGAGNGCPYCANKLVWPGYNDLLTCRPEVADTWHPFLNDLTPSEVVYGSDKKAWWLCGRGHHWEARISRRTRKKNPRGCPYCSNQKVWPGYNDLASQYPLVASEWDRDENGDLTPEDVVAGSNKGVKWVCDQGHRWPASVVHRTGHGGTQQPTGCPHCRANRVLPGYNDIATLHPDLMREWDYETNVDLDPTRITAGNGTPVGWKCHAHGHKWTAQPYSRTKLRTGCPVCANRIILVGFNDLATTHSWLLAEWDYESNGDFTPQRVTAGNSDIRVAWVCQLGHRWKTVVAARTKADNPTGCRTCTMAQTSHSERALRDAIIATEQFVDIEPAPQRLEVPYTLPDSPRPNRTTITSDIAATHTPTGQPVVIEYDGDYYHRQPEQVATDLAKTKGLLAAGYLVVRVREYPLPSLQLAHPRLLQISARYSREAADFLPTACEVADWCREQKVEHRRTESPVGVAP